MNCSHALTECGPCRVSREESDRKWKKREELLTWARIYANLAHQEVNEAHPALAALYAESSARFYFKAERITR